MAHLPPAHGFIGVALELLKCDTMLGRCRPADDPTSTWAAAWLLLTWTPWGSSLLSPGLVEEQKLKSMVFYFTQLLLSINILL